MGSSPVQPQAGRVLQVIGEPARHRGPAWPKAVALLLLFSLGACMKVGPDFEAPEAPVQDNWLEEGDNGVKADPAELTTWWDVFEDPVLTRLVETAYRQNRTLQSAGLRVLEARAQLGIAIGSFYPQVQNAVGSYSYNYTSRNGANLGDFDNSFQDLTVGIDATWEFDFWGKFARSIESSDASLGATVANYDDFLVILTAEVARFYVVVREAEERIRLARENTVIQRRTLQIASARFRAGAVSELDVQQARSLLAETESDIPFYQILRRRAQNALAVLLGMPPSELVAIMGSEGRIPTAPEEVAVGVPNELLRRRPDIRRAELRTAAQNAQIGVARAQLFPSFSLGGFVGLQTSGSVDSRSNNANLSDFFDYDSFTGFIGPTISWPFLNYGRLTNNVRVQDARLQALIADYENAVLEAYREVEDGLVGFLRSRDQAEFLTTSVEASKRAVEIALRQYRNGLVDYTRVLETQTALVERQDNLAVAQSAIAQNLVLSYRGLGGGWQIRGPNEFVPDETIEVMRERTDWGSVLPAEDIADAPTRGEEAGANTYFRRVDF
ncbi:MAG: efflux transporter outer membrane subunit [Kiloniellales bacterium]|nr:efflux transporter outer membrane subunit [Kiloniellales bacterium]